MIRSLHWQVTLVNFKNPPGLMAFTSTSSKVLLCVGSSCNITTTSLLLQGGYNPVLSLISTAPTIFWTAMQNKTYVMRPRSLRTENTSTTNLIFLTHSPPYPEIEHLLKRLVIDFGHWLDIMQDISVVASHTVEQSSRLHDRGTWWISSLWFTEGIWIGWKGRS